jgi:hypothetical protein
MACWTERIAGPNPASYFMFISGPLSSAPVSPSRKEFQLVPWNSTILSLEPSHVFRVGILILLDSPRLVRLVTSGRSPSIPYRALLDRLTHCHSSYRHGAHTVGLGIVFQGVLLRSIVFCINRVTFHRMWFFTTHRPSG